MLFDRCVSEIEQAYAELGHGLGWRFLTGPRAAFDSCADVAFVALNPNEPIEDLLHPRASVEAGNACFVESSQGFAVGAAPVQQQMQRLLRELYVRSGFGADFDLFLHQGLLSANYLPFRKPRIADLRHKQASRAFAVRLWSTILASWVPQVVVTMDHEVYRGLTNLLRRANNSALEPVSLSTGWGEYMADISPFRIVASGRLTSIVRLPNLSAIKLFSRPQCAPHLQRFFDRVFANFQPCAVPPTS
jgi:hypothetical protein